MSNSGFSTCHHCTKRTIGCHSTCASYQQEQIKNKKRSTYRLKQQTLDDAFYDSIARARKSKR